MKKSVQIMKGDVSGKEVPYCVADVKVMDEGQFKAFQHRTQTSILRELCSYFF